MTGGWSIIALTKLYSAENVRCWRSVATHCYAADEVLKPNPRIEREKERILPIEKGNIEQKAGEVRCHQHFAQRELGLPFTNTSCHLSGTTGQWVTQPCGQETHHHDARINFMALYESLGHGKNLRSICPICINLIVLPCSSVLGGSPNWKRQSMKVL